MISGTGRLMARRLRFLGWLLALAVVLLAGLEIYLVGGLNASEWALAVFATGLELWSVTCFVQAERVLLIEYQEVTLAKESNT